MTDLTPESYSPPTHGVNVPLLRKVLEHITEHPEEWDQTVWARPTACGTAYCVAGWAVTMAGLTVDMERLNNAGYRGTLTDGRPVWDAAAALLGVPKVDFLDDAEGDIFDPCNDLHDIWRIASELTHGEIEIPELLR